MSDPDLIEYMQKNAEKVQVIVSRVDGWDCVIRYVIEITQQQGGETITAPLFSPAEQNRLKTECERVGLNLIQRPLRSQEHLIHTALTKADWGIADTGTVVIRSDTEEIRIATMLAETHIVVLSADAIKPDMTAITPVLQTIIEPDFPSYTAFITGASRTADIERVLAIGVHGPREMHLLIKEEG